MAQILDYGAWVTTLTRDDVLAIANEHLKDPFETAYAETFEAPPPDDVNTEQRLTIVATDLDPGSERIVSYLSSFGVPIDVAFFAFIEDEGRRYLARSWLISGEASGASPTSRKTSKKAEWNGKDWFVSFGDGLGRSWEDGRRYGFVSAGGDVWYSRTLRSLPVGARVFVHIPGSGYVAVGQTLKEAEPYATATVLVDGGWVPLSEQDLHANYVHGDPEEDISDDRAEYVVPVRWIHAVPRPDAYWEKGMFANQNSACKLRQEFTLDRLVRHFDLDNAS